MKKYFNYILLTLMVVGFIVIYFLLHKQTTKLAYVDLATVYDEFPMKKELEAKLMNVQNARKNILDSLQIQLNAMSMSIKSEKEVEAIQRFQIKKQEYLLKQKRFEEDNQTTTQNYSAQIWKQINQYVKDYGKNEGYTFILGTDGTGTIMYGAEEKDITKEVSKYVNEKYSGEKK
jgi:outer membrane protein